MSEGSPLHNSHVSGAARCDELKILSHRSASTAAKCKILPLCPSTLANYAAGATVQFIDFYGRDFVVTPDVLIPRPETEMMVDAVLNLAGKPILPGVKAPQARMPQDCSVLDVGTGSGCVAVSLALELPEAKVMACDISLAVLEVARENAARLGAEVGFLQADLMDGVAGDFDVVVANLPYVDPEWDWLDREALSAEPEIALYAEGGGLALIKKLIGQSVGRTKFLVLEADPCQHERIVDFAGKHDYSLLETRGFALVFEWC